MNFFKMTLVAIALWAGCLTPAFAVEATTDQIRAAARAAMLQGNIQAADALSAYLLEQDPNDAEALLVRAALARAVGDPVASRDYAARAYRLSGDDPRRYDAAMLAAEAEARQEHFTRAQLWLRRADQAAPTPETKDLVARSYAQVTARNPLSVQLRFSIRPSSNVNNGAETTVIEIGGLPFVLDDSGQQLGGYEASAGVSLSYRLSEDKTRRTELLGELYAKKVWLDSDAKAAAPDVEGSDFDYGAIIAGVRHTRLVWPDLGPSQITGLVGQSWYGGAEQARWLELQLGQIVTRDDNNAWRLKATFRDEKRLDDAINDSVSVGLSGELIHKGDNGTALTIGASARNYWSDSATVDSLLVGLHASYAFAQTGPIVPRVTASVSTRDYRSWVATPGGRRDDSVSLGLSVVWPEISYYGFVPQASLDARRVWSNVDIYDRNQISLGLTAVSRF